ncbi:MAG: LpxD N-terminal domain-containing protein, partial [Gemmatimonadota bacterium]
MTWTAAEVAEWVGGRLEGDAGQVLRGVAPVESAGPQDLTFLAHRKYLDYLQRRRPGAVLVAEEMTGLPEGLTCIRVRDPHLALARVLHVFYPPPDVTPHVAATAVVGQGVRLGAGVVVGAYAVVEEGAELGDRARLGAHCVVGRGARVGADSELKPHATLYPGTIVGARCIVHSGARIGCDGYGYAWDGEAHHKVPQVGRCVI